MYSILLLLLLLILFSRRALFDVRVCVYVGCTRKREKQMHIVYIVDCCEKAHERQTHETHMRTVLSRSLLWLTSERFIMHVVCLLYSVLCGFFSATIAFTAIARSIISSSYRLILTALLVNIRPFAVALAFTLYLYILY